MRRVGGNEAPNSGNESHDGSHRNQPISDLYPIHQQGAFPPYHQENHDYDHQPEAFPPPPDKAHAFPPPQADQQTSASYPATGTPLSNEHPTPAFHNYHPGFYDGGNMHGGIGGTPYTNPAFQPMPTPMPMPMPMPMPIPAVNQPSIGFNTEPWKSSLFDCCDDPENAIITVCCPCVTFGQIAEIVDQGQTSCGSSGFLYILISYCIAMPCLLSCTYRSKLRARFRLIESPGPDWIIHCFCEWCALCQEYRELKERGFDPAIGWTGNATRMGAVNGVAMTPPMQPMMMGR